MGPAAHRAGPGALDWLAMVALIRKNGTARPLAMSENGSNFYWGREELLGLLSNSATLAGLCVTVVALMSTFDKSQIAVSFVDDLFALCATAFLLCTYVIFWALRSSKGAIPTWLIKAIDVLFLLALTSMTGASFLMIFAIW